jgi:thiamine pyrophosphate-dependent acetolactate synthase large subunit-like protein
MTSVGEALIAGLAERGVDTIFGIPGVHTLELYRGLTTSGVRHVTPRHEQGAGFMADGWSRVSGRPGVCLVISGPGVTNVLTPIAQARQDARPLLVLSASVSRDERGRGRGVIHDLPDQAALTRAVTRLTVSIDEPDQLGPALDAAWAVLEGRQGPPGPVHLQVPVDVLRLAAEPPPQAVPAARRATLPSTDAIERAVALLAGAERPAVILGGGARDAGPAALALARRLGAPIGLTINGKGAVPASDPLCVPSRMMVAPFDRLFLEADVVLAVGTQLSDLDWWALEQPFAPAGRIIRVDLDAAVLDANAPAAVGLVGDAGIVLDVLASGLPERCAGPSAAAAADHVAAAAAATRWPAEVAAHLPLVQALDAVLPADRIVAVDSTQPGYAANHALDVELPGSWLMPIGYGCLGTALPMAIGACLAAPGRPVLAIAGDGGVLFTLPELAAARDLGLSLPLVVWNNGGYGEIRDAMRDSGMAVLGTDASAVDLPRVAEGFGCIGARASSLDHVQELVASALAAPVPTLIEVTPRTRGVAAHG